MVCQYLDSRDEKIRNQKQVILKKNMETVQEEVEKINEMVDKCAGEWDHERFVKEFQEFQRQKERIIEVENLKGLGNGFNLEHI